MKDLVVYKKTVQSQNKDIYRVFTGNCGKVIGNNTFVYQVICTVSIILFVLPNVEYLRENYSQFKNKD